jgi:adenylate kinase
MPKMKTFLGTPKTQKVLVVFGPPGAGKGTQAAMLSKRLCYLHLSTGQMFRDAVKSGSDLGKKVGKVIDAGNLVSDKMTSEIIDSYFSKNRKAPGIILDGYPRNINQCYTMDDFLKKYNLELEILNLTADSDELVKRLLKRAEIEKRKDDNKETIEKRLKIYEKDTKPILDYYKNKIKIYNIDGLGSIEEVNRRIMKSLKN